MTWLVRHAPVAVHGVCYGQSDVPTVVDAIEAAETVAGEWARTGRVACVEVWSSPWQRTRSVANVLAERWRVPHRIDARLSELHFGVWEGRHYADIERDDAARFGDWMRAYETARPPGGETLSELVARVASWLDETHRIGPVLAVTHAGVVRVARTLRDGVSYAEALRTPVGHLACERF